jgi:hypothetical protein
MSVLQPVVVKTLQKMFKPPTEETHTRITPAKHQDDSTPKETMSVSSALMVEQDDAADADLLLQEFDFPENYVNMAHPDDGNITSTPITPEFIRHSRRGHFRMLVRMSFSTRR